MIRGLSLTRPWPFAFKHGKRVENRSWRPSGTLKGCWIALHAAKSWSEDDREYITNATGLYVPTKKECPDSQIFALARWDGEIILPTPETEEPDLIPGGWPLPEDQEKWFFGPFGWLLKDYFELPEPVGCDGALSLWKLPTPVLDEVRRQYQIVKEVV